MRKICSTIFMAAVVVASSMAFAAEPGTTDTGGAPKLVLPEFGDKETIWGRVGLMYRALPQFRSNADLDSDTADKNFFIWQRARMGLGLNYAAWFKTFVQFQDARTAGFGNGSTAYTGNADLHQAWAQVQLADDAFQLKIGRQQLVYGDQRLIGHLEWANQGRVFDAVKARWNNPIGWLDVFAATFAADTGGNLMNSTTFYGLYNQLQLAGGSLVWEQYLLGLFDTDGAQPTGVVYDASAGGAPAPAPGRHFGTLGTRVNYDAKPVDATLELAYQFGTFDREMEISQNAFAAHGDVRFHLPAPMNPYLKIEANFATGGDDDDDGTSERFQNLFPTNHAHYGYMDLASWSNAINGSLGAGFTPNKHLSLALDYWLLARADTDDAWLDAGGGTDLANTGAATDDDRMIGHEIDLSAKVPINKHLKVAGGMGVFLPTGYAEGKGNDPQFWTFAMLLAGF